MPTVLRLGGTRVFFFSNEGDPREPLHVHVRNADKLAKFWVEPEISLEENFGFNSRELRDIETAIRDNEPLIRTSWDAHFGS